MKIHPVNFLAAIIICALLTYGISMLDTNPIKFTMGIGSFIFFACTLAVAMGITFNSSRVGVNIKVVAIVFFIISLALNLIFGFFSFSQATYIISSGILFLLYVVVANGIFRAPQ